MRNKAVRSLVVMVLAAAGGVMGSAWGQSRWVKLSDPAPMAVVTGGFQIGPLGERVAYLHDAQTPSAFDLSGDVRDFDISPDSSRVVYVADQHTNDVVLRSGHEET